MRGIKYFSVIVLLLSIYELLNAETKVIEKSERLQPEWVHVSQTNYLVVNGIDLTLDKAKSNAHNSLKNLVLTTTVNQMKSTNTYFRTINIGNDAAIQLVKNSAYYTDLDTEGQFVFYWERIKDKETKLRNYHYYLQYSLSEERMERAISQIALDHEISSTLDTIKNSLPDCYKVGDLNNMYVKLMNLNSKLSDDDSRKATSEELLATIEENFKNVEVNEVLNIPGKLVVSQTLNNRGVYASKPPKVTAGCARIMDIKNMEEQWIITYKYNYCRNSGTDVIHVEFDNVQNKVTGAFTVNTNEDRVEVKLTGAPIIIKRNHMIKFYVASTYRDDVVLQRMVIRYNDLHYTDTQLNQLLDGAGLYTIRYLTPPGFFRVKTGKKVSGELHYISKKTGHKEILRFYNQDLAIQNE